MAITATPRTASMALHIGGRLLSRSSRLFLKRADASTSTFLSRVHYRAVSSLKGGHSLVLFHQQIRPITSMGRPSTSKPTQTYSALRNNVTMPFEVEPGRPYVSPYSQFFANLEAGRTSLGTTEEMEQRAAELLERRLECGIPESELRFQTVSYGRFALPPYVSPGEHRVTVKVALAAIPFKNELEKEIFLEIVGSRFDPKKGDLKLSSEKFASRIENKRYLVDMIERIVSNARKLAKEFADEELTTR
jgi:hypothetical protein